MMRLPFACSSLIFPIRGACTGKAGATPRQGTDKSVAMADEKAFYYRRKSLLLPMKKPFLSCLVRTLPGCTRCFEGIFAIIFRCLFAMLRDYGYICSKFNYQY